MPEFSLQKINKVSALRSQKERLIQQLEVEGREEEPANIAGLMEMLEVSTRPVLWNRSDLIHQDRLEMLIKILRCCRKLACLSPR